MRLLITGGLGFIGSNFIRHIRGKYPTYQILNLDKKTYAGNPENLKDLARQGNYRWIRSDITCRRTVDSCMKKVDAVVHFAAESHVDRSIFSPAEFLKTNIFGTQVLLEAARKYRIQRFIHVSTDEVYGSLERGFAKEEDPLRPNSPYAASKASADHLVRAYHKTHQLPAVITRSSNNFGPYQFPEKVIPLFITNALTGQKLPLYGDGLHVRDWLFVSDHCKALDRVLHHGLPGEIYNIGGSKMCPNSELTRTILHLMGKPQSLTQHVPDRPGHDRRYALDCGKIQRELGWKPETPFEEALRFTIRWYQENKTWWAKIKGRKPYQTYYKKQYTTLLS